MYYGKMKYVRFTDQDGFQQIIVFSFTMNHNETIKRIRHLEIISAGFVLFGRNGTVECVGRSESLNVDSHETDSKFLQAQMRGY